MHNYKIFTGFNIILLVIILLCCVSINKRISYNNNTIKSDILILVKQQYQLSVDLEKIKKINNTTIQKRPIDSKLYSIPPDSKDSLTSGGVIHEAVVSRMLTNGVLIKMDATGYSPNGESKNNPSTYIVAINHPDLDIMVSNKPIKPFFAYCVGTQNVEIPSIKHPNTQTVQVYQFEKYK